jgi:acetoacetyl-CoA reductase
LGVFLWARKFARCLKRTIGLSSRRSWGIDGKESTVNKKIALVTGGVGGIGTAICKRLASDGCFVIANYAIPGTEIRWQANMAAAGLNGSQSALAFGDVCDFDAMGKMVREIEEEYGPIDILVNCAGITRDGTFRKMTPEQWGTVINTNLTSVFNVTRQVIDGMCERGWGRIINISSVNAVKGQFGQTNYSAAKAGILGFTKSLAQEVIKKGITVNAVSPGYIDTDMTRAIRDDVRNEIVAGIPAGRMGLPEDIANTISFLASDDAAYITGTNMAVNGGMHMYA